MSKELHPNEERAETASPEKKGLSRRAFLAMGVTGFTLLAAAPLVVNYRNRRRSGAAVPDSPASIPPDTVFIKNPAFQKQGRNGNRAVLKTRTVDGKDLAFEVDEWGEAAWDLAINVEEYQKGKRLDCGSILAALEERRSHSSGGGDATQFRKDFDAFVNAARQANLLMDGDQFVWSVFNEA